MLTAPIAVNSRGVEGPAKSGGRRFKRAVGIAIGTMALGAVAALFAGLYEDHPLTPTGVPGASARVQLPGDLFAPPRAPNPRVVVRYTAPRYMPPAPVAAAAAPMARPTAAAPMARPTAAAPTASPTATEHHHHPSPSPSPSGGGDD
ncbi:MAG TPA: hypothetical protein VGR77_04775 [Candidatus Dormibacteraeota bacterium]|nr:hypothetical protein [Candidatus Dormibacteraeota bacterium]